MFDTNGDTVNWFTSENVTDNGEILKLTFTVAENTEADDTDITVTPHGGKKNLTNEEGTPVDANYQPGTVKINKVMLGDINGDGEILMGDVVQLNRHVLGKITLEDSKLLAADCNGDREITMSDVVMLNRHVSGKQSLKDSRAYLAELGDYLGAGGSMTISVDDAKVKPGETFDLPVWIEDNTGVAGMALKFNIPEGFTLNSITAGDILPKDALLVEGNTCTFFVVKNISTDGVIMTLNLTASETAKNGKVSVAVKDDQGSNITDEHGGSMLVEFASGIIAVDNENAAADQTAADGVADEISSIPSLDNISLSDEDKIEQARAAYEALTPEQKALVPDKTLKALEAAEAKIKELKKQAEKQPVAVSEIKLEGISHNIAAGKKIKLTATVLPEKAANKGLKWSVSNKKVASVTQKGVVTIRKKTGKKTVIVKAEATDGSGTFAIWKIKSMKGVVKKITIKGAKKTLKAGKSIKLKVKVKASSGANKKVKWTSSNEEYATVSSSGKVKTLKAGKGKKVKITAMATDGSNKKKSVTIKLK